MQQLFTAITSFIENPETWKIIADLTIPLLPTIVDYWINKKIQSPVLTELKIEKNFSFQLNSFQWNYTKTVSHNTIK